ncbi:MAG TPA: 4Fe-4S dicluster domain-containing protein [Caldilineae bacterium]|nr:4Fe-4S dicluster domain-containing protein [Caldilineae bacterium]
MKRIYVKEEYCIACTLCEIHCLVQHSRSRDIIRAFKRETPRPIPRAIVERDGPNSLSLQCRHCAEPLCVYSCLTGAMHRDEQTGIILVDPERCIGCWTCIMACPYGVIRRGMYKGHPVAVKCDLCPDREIPACVDNCPNGALTFAEEAPHG